MKILIVEDEQKTGAYLKQGLFESVFAAAQTSAVCQRRFASTMWIPSTNYESFVPRNIESRGIKEGISINEVISTL